MSRSRWRDAAACGGGVTGWVKGTSSETTMQILCLFVWQATTLLCVYAKPGKTLCTQPCCQSGVMLDWWHPMGDPCVRRGCWARFHPRQTHTHKHLGKLSHVAHVTSQGSNVAGRRDLPLLVRNLPRKVSSSGSWSRYHPRWGENYLISTLNLLSRWSVWPPRKIKHSKPH